MYPTGNRQPDPKLQADLEYLLRTVEDSQHKPYLKGPLIDSLTSLGHDAGPAREAVEAYFKVTYQ